MVSLNMQTDTDKHITVSGTTVCRNKISPYVFENLITMWLLRPHRTESINAILAGAQTSETNQCVNRGEGRKSEGDIIGGGIRVESTDLISLKFVR